MKLAQFQAQTLVHQNPSGTSSARFWARTLPARTVRTKSLQDAGTRHNSSFHVVLCQSNDAQQIPHRAAGRRETMLTSASSDVNWHRGVVITGGTKGLGLAMAKEFVEAGDRVVICGRSQGAVDKAVGFLRDYAREHGLGEVVHGIQCDVGSIMDVEALGRFAVDKLGIVHLWINNAGQVTSKKLLASVPPEEIVSAVSANVTGSLLCCREAVKIMMEQPATLNEGMTSGPPYRIFNMGFSKWGAAFTKSAATHKSTKLALSQLNVSLAEELQQAGISWITVHNLSPGMVLTDLLLQDSTPGARRFFNALAEEPETVAASLVAEMRNMPPTETSGASIDYLSPVSAFLRVLSRFPQIINGGRFFDKDGKRVALPGERYAANGVRLQIMEEAASALQK